MKATRAQLYFRLATLIETGIAIPKAFKIVAENSKDKGFLLAADALQQDGDLQKALITTKAFSSLEIALSITGEKSGTLPDIWRYLSEYHEKRARRIRQWISKLYYPAFMVHAGIVVGSAPMLISTGMNAFLTTVMISLLSLYSTILVPIIIFHIARSYSESRRYVDYALVNIPFISKVLIYMHTSYAFTIIHGMYYSGINIKSAFNQAQHSISFVPLQEALGRIKDKISAGQLLADAMQNETIFPRAVYEAILVGEEAGKLDTTLKKMCEFTNEMSSDLLDWMIRIVTGIVVGLVMLWIVVQIFASFGGYVSAIGR
ncbi:type II secretion system F family protein [Candidatus Uabimicrobium amorphum]|uniref:General secretion pathway protein GspF n=1 Tax=Uabimicrobium amorphum TaxID=2596890 RepID=A0A5S9F4Y2_UABAM|nr:type II secretion system F family protein [Candidatus Uabimicrobium amorphum]BBM84702.1 general secretion pathway protein GspF [Candidatus Uabimicrobium amorphum]